MMIPITRKEKYINEIVGGGDTAPETPQTREEFFFADILGEVIAPSPVTRAEKYLSAIAGQYSGDLPTPITRIEYFLARAAGMDVTIPTPITREEMLWANYALIVEKELSGMPPLTFKAKKAGTLNNYRIYGNTEKVREKNTINVSWEQGTIASDDGSLLDSTTRMRSERIPVDPNTTYTVKATTSTGNALKGWLLGFDFQDNKTIRYPLPQEDMIYPRMIYPMTFTTSANTAFIRLVAAYSNESTISIQPITELYEGENTYYEKKYHCGDKTVNLFDGEFLQGCWAGADGSYLANYPTQICTDKLPCKPNTAYTLSFNSANSRWYGFFWFAENGDYILSDTAQSPQTQCHYTATSPSNAAYMAIDIAGYPDIQSRITPSDVTDFMLVEGTTPLPYEPYGYRIPITLTADSAETTDIYLDEPLAKSENNADYIDYATQKRHNSDGTESSVTLPEISTLAGTNTLTVGTEVQPSSVEIKGRIQEVTP